MEQKLSIVYGLPTWVFRARSGSDEAYNQEQVDKLFKEVDTESGFIRLANDFGLMQEYPHFMPQATTVGGRNRLKARIDFFGDPRAQKSNPNSQRLHTISINTGCKEYIEQLSDNGFKMRAGKASTLRYTSSKKDYHQIYSEAVLAKSIGAVVDERAQLFNNGKPQKLLNAGSILPGWVVGCRNGNEVLRSVVSSKEFIDYDGYVYDLSIKNTACYFADNVAVHNSIYAFAGADSESMKNIEYTLSNTQRGCITLDLSVSWRCPRKVIYHAQEILQQVLEPGQATIEPAPHAPEGEIRNLPDEIVFESITKEDAYPRGEYTVAMFLCRTNAPLFGAALKLIARGIPAVIRGRDICKNIIDYINDINPERNQNINVFANALRKRVEKITELEKATGNDFQAERDKIAVLDILSPKANKVSDLKDELEKLFNSGKCSKLGCDYKPETDDEYCVKCADKGITSLIIKNPGVIFSTIHKAKGLEALKIFILDPTRLGRALPGATEEDRRQEIHLHYVAVTRTKFTKDSDSGVLTYVLEKGSPDYGPQFDVEFDAETYEPAEVEAIEEVPAKPVSAPTRIRYKIYKDSELTIPFVYPEGHSKEGKQVSYKSKDKVLRLLAASRKDKRPLYSDPDPQEEISEPLIISEPSTISATVPEIPSIWTVEELRSMILPSAPIKGKGTYTEPTLDDWRKVQAKYLAKDIPAKIVILPGWGQYALVVNAIVCSNTTVNIFGGTRGKGRKALRVMQPNEYGEFIHRKGRTIKRTGGWEGRVIDRLNEILLLRSPTVKEIEAFREMQDVGGQHKQRKRRRRKRRR